jgi:hypothetical protein
MVDIAKFTAESIPLAVSAVRDSIMDAERNAEEFTCPTGTFIKEHPEDPPFISVSNLPNIISVVSTAPMHLHKLPEIDHYQKQVWSLMLGGRDEMDVERHTSDYKDKSWRLRLESNGMRKPGRNGICPN